MGTEVLRPQNCLIERFREPPSSAAVFHRRRNGNGYYNNRKPVVKTEKKKSNNNNNKNQIQSEPLISRKSPARSAGRVIPATDGRHVTGHVTILRRGESLDSLNPKIRKENGKTSGPGQPDMSPKQIRVGFTPADVYAGSAAFSNSPSPRSVPLPSFFNKKSFDDSATRDLRRLLRLE